MKRLRDQIEEQKGQIGKLAEQGARLEVVERELKLAQETNDRLKLELEGTRRQLDSARREGGRFATPPATGEKKGQGTDVYAP
jgi:regulator of replication initiation timing